jgi:hypothetical protein
VKAVTYIALIGVLCFGAACTGPEGRAAAIYEESMAKIDAGELQEGVALLQKVLAEYPDTKAAERAREEIDLFRGLAGAIENYPVSGARDLMVRTARVLERLRHRNRLPASLDDLVPGSLETAPVDPWGVPLGYTRSRNGRGYTLNCFGSDGVLGGAGADADIVIRNGEFMVGGW